MIQPVESDPVIPHTLADLLDRRSKRHPDRTAATFIQDDDVRLSLTYRQLDQRAREIAVELYRHGEPGDRALMLFPAGLEFVAGFFGCCYAGMIPVPTCYPKPGRPMPRLDAAAHDCDPRVLLSDTETLALIDPSRLSDQVANLPAVMTDDTSAVGASGIDPQSVTPEMLGLLQYTSGSTSEPKGVMVTHGNLVANLAAIREGFGIAWQDDRSSDISRGVFWLPAFHDMGLIGGILEPLYVGGETILMSPQHFLRRPKRWLETISEYRAIISGAPNFAYQLCVDRADASWIRDLDLSCWITAFCGAEPILPETLENFARVFGPCGFRSSSFYPCYGLAENTLLASGGHGPRDPEILAVDRDPLATGKIVVADDSTAQVRRLISCGPEAVGTKLRIVDAETRRLLPEDTVGEIWLQGDSLALGYWQREEINAEMFGAEIVDGEPGKFFRTGDLGFLHRGQLYVTGRLKDVIILRGRNHYPQDIELSARRAMDGEAGSIAAFAISGRRGDVLAIVVEASRHLKDEQLPDYARAVRRAIIEDHEVDPRHVVLGRPGAVPLTTSGKIQHGAARAAFEADEIKTRYRWDHASSKAEGQAYPEVTIPQNPREAEAVGRQIERWLLDWLVVRGGVAKSLVHADKPLAEYGLDSLAAVELSSELEDWLGLELTPVLAWNYPTPAKLSRYLAARLGGADPDVEEESTEESVAQVADEELETLLSEIEQLSDDEIQDALASKRLS